MAEQKFEKPSEFSALYFRAKCDGRVTPETQSTPQRTIHGRTAEFRINSSGFIICAFDGAGSEETDEAYPFKFHINIKDDANHTKLEQAWAIVVDVCAREGIGLVKVFNIGEAERIEAKSMAEKAKAKPAEPPVQLTPEQEEVRKKKEEDDAEERRKEAIIEREQRRKKITIYCDRTDWRDATQRNKRVMQIRVALQIIQNRLKNGGFEPAELPAFDGRLRLGENDSIQGSPYVSITYRSSAAGREQHYVPHSSHIPGWDPFASCYRLPHPITPDPEDQNPFHRLEYADQEGLVYEMLEQLERNYPNVEDRRAILNMPDRLNGNTPLHLAAQRGRWRVYNALKQAGADETIENKTHKTPVQIAIAKQKEIFEKETQKSEASPSTLTEQKRPEELKQIWSKEKEKKKKKHNKKEKKEQKETQSAQPSSTPKASTLKRPGISLANKGSLGDLKDEEGNLLPVPETPSAPVGKAPPTTLPIVPVSKPTSIVNPEQQLLPATGRLSAQLPTEGQQPALLGPRATPVQRQLPSSAKPAAPSLGSHLPPQTSRQQNKAAFSAGVTAQAVPLKAPAPKAAGTETEETKQPPASTPPASKGSS